ncbi:MAG TPA: hypothetical protein VFB12_31015 [Ktedonobacteraceae bacterium]|nr:hypothetical protein [Ktedonobacteraceae bacterium]
MKLKLSSFPKRLMALAILLALALTLSVSSATHAAPVTASNTVTVLSTSCLSATPAIQRVAVGQAAHITILISCPPGSPSFVTVAWGDGSTTEYTACSEVCRVFLDATHTYTARGTYHPEICLVHPPSGTTSDCTTVEIIVN